MRRRRPSNTRIGLVASSVDGRISTDPKRVPEWTSREDWTFLQNFLKNCDAVVVGRNTFRAAEARLRTRNTFVLSHRVSKTRSDRGVTWVNPKTVSLKTILRPYRRVAILGGSGVYQYALDTKLMTELYVTVEPVVLGRGVPMVSGGRKNTPLVLTSVRKLNKKGTLLLHYTT